MTREPPSLASSPGFTAKVKPGDEATPSPRCNNWLSFHTRSMTKLPAVVLLLCVAAAVVSVGLISHPKPTLSESWLRPMPAQRVGTSPRSVAPPTPAASRLLYLVQTESCLPDHLVETFVDARVCQCDVLVLSYKEPCRLATPSHVEYLFNSSTTWTTGRNLLYLVAKMWRSEIYLYYVFIDDDIVLKSVTRDKQPWRAFEDFLKRIEPAVAAVELASSNTALPVIYNARRHYGCALNGSSEYLPTVKFDPAVNAFHYQAVDYLLPYSSKFDNVTWWASGLGLSIKCEMMFRGHVVLHTGLRAVNAEHRKYPQRRATASEVLAMIDEVEAALPDKYRNSKLLIEWKRDGYQHQRTSSTLCLPPPSPHLPIRPFGYMKDEPQESIMMK